MNMAASFVALLVTGMKDESKGLKECAVPMAERERSFAAVLRGPKESDYIGRGKRQPLETRL